MLPRGTPVADRIRDVRLCLRALARHPWFTASVVLVLALGIGAATAVFSVVNGVLLEPLPYPQSGRIVGLWHGAPNLGYKQFGISPGIFHLYQSEGHAYRAMGLYRSQERNLTEGGDAERVPVVAATRGPHVAVLGYGLWQRRFGGDPAILGRAIRVDGTPTQVVGIMPRTFDFGGPTRKADIWVPLHLDLAEEDPGDFSFSGVARLADGVTLRAAHTEEAALLLRARQRWAGEQTFVGFLDAGGVHPIVHSLRDEVVGETRKPLWILLGTVGVVLLIACANVASLLLVRGDGRRREIAVRAALGASGGRIARSLLMESSVLAVAGGAAGLALAWAGMPLLLKAAPPELPRIAQVTVDRSVLAFAAAITLLSALLSGAAPAVRASAVGLAGVLRQSGSGATGGAGRHGVRDILVVGQTALAMILLVGSALMVKSFWAIGRIDPGFDTHGILTFRVSLPSAEYSGGRVAAFHERLLERLRALPGVEAAGGVSEFPLLTHAAGTAYLVEGLPIKPGVLPPMFYYKYAAPGYFRAMGIGLVAGRTLAPGDTDAVVVSRALAERVWPGQQALGKRIRVESDTAAGSWERVVGVVENTRDHGLREDPIEVVYHPLVGPHGDEGRTVPSLSYAVRAANPLSLVGAVRSAVKEMDPGLPVAGVQTIEEVVSASIVRLTFTALALAVAAFMALALAAMGLYGVLSYVVAQRTQEIGVRMALGAQAGHVVRMVVDCGARLAGVGLAVGLAGAAGLTRLLQGLLYGTTPLDPVTFAATSMVFLAVALPASWLPARRAASVDPLRSLRLDP